MASTGGMSDEQYWLYVYKVCEAHRRLAQLQHASDHADAGDIGSVGALIANALPTYIKSLLRMLVRRFWRRLRSAQ